MLAVFKYQQLNVDKMQSGKRRAQRIYLHLRSRTPTAVSSAAISTGTVVTSAVETTTSAVDTTARLATAGLQSTFSYSSD